MILCRLRLHQFTERDEFGRVTCHRCGKRQPVVFEIRDADYARNHLSRPKTKGRRR